MSVPASATPQNIGEVLLKFEPDKMTLTPRPRSVTVNAIINAAFALWFTYRAILAAQAGLWGWMAFCIFLVLMDILFVYVSLLKRNERVVIDKATNRIQGRTDATAVMVSEVQRVQVVKNAVSFIAFEKQVRPSVLLLTLRDNAEARWLGQILADFIGVPLQVMA